MSRCTTVTRLLTMTAVMAAIQACSVLGPPRPDEEVVRERAQARWDARLAGDVETAYSYASPAYRAAFDAKAFGERFGMGVAQWKSAAVKSVSCNGDVCDVEVHISYATTLMKGRLIESDLNERWVREEGQWWIYLKV